MYIICRWKITATILIALIVISNLGSDSSNNTNSDTVTEIKDPLNLGLKTVQSLIGEKVPYDKWVVWGYPKTQNGTDNQNWIVYLDSANISFVSNKSSDKIIFAGFGETSAVNYINKITGSR